MGIVVIIIGLLLYVIGNGALIVSMSLLRVRTLVARFMSPLTGLGALALICSGVLCMFYGWRALEPGALDLQLSLTSGLVMLALIGVPLFRAVLTLCRKETTNDRAA